VVARYTLLLLACTAPAKERTGAPWARCAPFVAHALGAVDSFLYTNSREAFEQNYKRGFRVFEVDLRWTTDGVLVAAHDWHTPSRLRVPRGGPTLAQFRQAIYSRYSALTYADMLALLRTHPDAWLLLDLKNGPRAMLPQVVQATEPALLARMIPHLFSPADIKAAVRLHQWPALLYSLHYTKESDAEVLATVRRYGIELVTVGRFRMNPNLARRLREAGATVYYSLVNTAPEARLYREWGAMGFYTDLLAPDSSCKGSPRGG
jgi:glycerophosphoryl diester phosphodiesterase